MRNRTKWGSPCLLDMSPNRDRLIARCNVWNLVDWHRDVLADWQRDATLNPVKLRGYLAELTKWPLNACLDSFYSLIALIVTSMVRVFCWQYDVLSQPKEVQPTLGPLHLFGIT